MPNNSPHTAERQGEVDRPQHSRGTLGEWRAHLRNATQRCPYAGPRPQTPDDAGLLLGRAEDLETLTRMVLDRRLVILDGRSGSGKSSLLQNGLLTSLRTVSKFTVLVAREWLPLPEQLTKPNDTMEDWEFNDLVEQYVARCMTQTHKSEGSLGLPKVCRTRLEKLCSAPGLCRVFDQDTVFVLDQFEELLRRPGLAPRKIVDWIKDTGYMDPGPRIVVSLRTDSYHLLEPLLRGVRPFSMDRHTVEEITKEDTILEIISTTRGHEGQPPTKDAAKLLAEYYRERGQPSLLSLQATLYALYFKSSLREEAGLQRPFMLRDVTDLGDAAEKENPKNPDPFSLGLRNSIEERMANAEKACEAAGHDEYLISGTREIVRRIVPLLSSGDFKVPVNEVDVAVRVLEREWQILRHDIAREVDVAVWPQEELVPSLFSASRGPASTPHDSLLTARFDELELPDDLKLADRGRTDAAAGPMMSSAAIETLLEEVRRVAFAIEWLAETEIVKRDPQGTLLLVHDGSGSALTTWARDHQPGSREALYRLTGSRGENYDWLSEGEKIGTENDDFEVIANVNWRDCRVSANFRRVVFVNCDFSGTRFHRCNLNGVTFINCLLDDANFEYCEIDGGTGLIPIAVPRPGGTSGQVRLAPSFMVDASNAAPAFEAYGQDRAQGTAQRFFSDTSGLSAEIADYPTGFRGRLLAHFALSSQELPPTFEDEREKVWLVGERTGQVAEARPATGGVAMFGGRVCFLTLYGCKALNAGCFAFHHVSGDGLYIVEPHGMNIDIHDSAIRGISVSRDSDGAKDEEDGLGQGYVRLTICDTYVQNGYFSARLGGSAYFDYCNVLMLLNANQTGFEATLHDSGFQCVVNTAHSPECPENSRRAAEDPERFYNLVAKTESSFTTRLTDTLASDLSRMDYRFRPDVWEQKKRRPSETEEGA